LSAATPPDQSPQKSMPHLPPQQPADQSAAQQLPLPSEWGFPEDDQGEEFDDEGALRADLGGSGVATDQAYNDEEE